MSRRRRTPNMAATTGQNGKACNANDADLLLHPELLSQDFMRLILSERNVSTRDCGNRDRLTELYLRHVIPLPQRTLPNNRWGRRMEKSRARQTPTGNRTESSTQAPITPSKETWHKSPCSFPASSIYDHNRKRPLIVFDGSSSHSGLLKVNTSEGTAAPTGTTDRLKPPPAAHMSNPIRRLTGNSSSSSSSAHHSTDTAHLKREASSSAAMKSPEVKKKIQHVTWP